MRVRSSKWVVRGVSWAAVLAVAAAVVASGSARVSAAPSCGATIVADAVLTADLRCPADGLVVAADGVTLDLGGHVLRGTGGGVGVSIAAQNVTLRNGTVRGFHEGVHVAAGSSGGNTGLTRLIVIRNDLGVVVRSPAGTIDESTVSENGGDGVRMNGATGWIVRDSIVGRNGGSGLSLFFSSGAVVTRSTVTGNTGSGVVFSAHVDNSRIVENVVAGNGDLGISVADSTTQVLRNVVRSNGSTGISLVEAEGGLPFGPFYLIAGNVSSKNGGAGITACIVVPGDTCAAGMVDGGGNTARFNGVTPECVNVTCMGIRD